MKNLRFITIHIFVFTFLLCSLVAIQTNAAPNLSTNGKIVFTSDRDGNSEIYLMNADGSGQTRLTNNSVRDDYPTWSPDGRKIAFIRQNGSVFSINLMNADGTNQTQITTFILYSNISYPYEHFSMSWSPDGAKIAFQDAKDISTINIDGSNRINLTGSQFINYEPTWSPDGSRIAFARSIYSHGFYAEIFTINPNGDDVRKITTSEAYCESRSPDWSPDGGQIALADCVDIDPYSISTVNPDGTNLQRILLFDGGANVPVNNMPKWSPDGTRIVFYRNGYSTNISQIWTMNRDGSGLTQLTNASPNNFHPDWQPLTPELGLIVTRSDDRNATCVPGDCSLREAVNAANSSATGDTINFASGLTTITLTNEIVINNAGALTINGTGANDLTIDGGAGTHRIFYINHATATISGMTLTGGNPTGTNNTGGGAIAAGESPLTLDGVNVTGNIASDGGGVYLSGSSDNRIINSTISGNTAYGVGGGFLNGSGSRTTVVNSTISGNTARSGGGFENSFSGSLTVINSTISGNTASTWGGGFRTVGYATLRNVTITNNTAPRGGGIYQDYAYDSDDGTPYPATLNLGNTIVAGNISTTGIGPEIYNYQGISIITSAGGNLVGDSPGDSTNTGSPITYQPTDIRDTNPLLSALQNNGGTTSTHALLAESPAIDKGINALVSPLASVFDQRGAGFVRIRDGNGDGTATVDIGAFEVQPGAAVNRPTFFDFDGDSKADVSVFRPSNGTWYLQQSTNGFTGFQFGIPTNKIVPADYDGDGKTDIAVYRDGIWYLQKSGDGFVAVNFGLSTDVPMPADFSGDGEAEIAFFRPSNGGWHIYNLANNQVTFVQFGQAGDVPVAADYDGDGRADVAVFRNGAWYIQRSRDGFTGITFGQSGDKPVPADYDGDGRTDVAVFGMGNWYIQRSSTNSLQVVNWGLGIDALVPADYDGDGKADVAVFRDGIWYIRQSSGGINYAYFGSSGDVPTNQVQ